LSATGTWLWLQCGGNDNFTATELPHLVAAAAALDLNVLLCQKPARPTGAPMDRVAVLPAAARCTFYGTTKAKIQPIDSLLRYFAQVSSVLGIESLQYVLMVTHVIDMGSSADEVTRKLRELLRYKSTDFAATPRLLTRTKRGASTLFTYGRGIGEVAGGLYTLTARLMGSSENTSAASAPVPVASGSGLLLAPRRLLELAVQAATARCVEAPGRWAIPRRPSMLPHAVQDLAFAALRLPTRAVPVSVHIATHRWPAWGEYESLTCDISRGGPDYDNQDPGSILRGMHELLPPAMSDDPTRGREARRANTAAEHEAAEDVTLFWEMPETVMCHMCNGFTIEAINSMVAVESRLQTRAVVWTHCWAWCRDMSRRVVQSLARMVQPKAGSGSENFTNVPWGPRRVAIWVSHAPLQHVARFPYQGYNAFRERPYVVSRSMVAVDRVSPSWAAIANSKDVQEVWVPSKSSRDAFLRGGVQSSRVFVVPDGIDHHVFDPAVVEPSSFMSDARYATHYKFLSNFKMDVAKGWETLLGAYFTTFAPDAKVVLYIKTVLRNQPLAKHHDSALGRREILRWAAKELGNRTEAELPPFVVIAESMSVPEVTKLYRAADCFVLPTKGEGWGLPFQEAMSMALPTIGTAWGGQMQFMNATNSLLIDIDGLEHTTNATAPLLPADDASKRREPHRARPSLKHTGQQMRWAFEHPEKARAIGAIARQHIARYFSLEAHAQHVMDRVVAIHKYCRHRR
jgi:glycosyltransferase involved in cell wall biosynthesis